MNNDSRHCSAESVEGRGPTKGNAKQPPEFRTQGRADSTTGLQRVRAAASRDREAQFTALLHHVTPDLLEQSFYALKRDAAPGIDGVTWAAYEGDLGTRLAHLHERLHSGSYRTDPSRRSRIPKADGGVRQLGVATLDDKVAQRAIVFVLEQIYEADFRPFSYGFRRGRSQHDALDALWVGLHQRKVNWVLDADIRGFFESIDHDWMLEFVKHRVGDRRVIRLIQKWMKAGYIDDAGWTKTETGTPQGGVISPLLANVYLHYVFDLWVDQWRNQRARGDVIVVRYADDFVVGFEHRAEAERFLAELKERLAKFSLELHPDKTRLIEFGRFAAERRRRRGEGKPETFDFLGFTHRCGATRQGKFTVHRQPIAKRTRARLSIIRRELRKRKHAPRATQGAWLQSVLRGWMNYYAVPGTCDYVARFRDEIARHWHRTLARRSDKGRRTWTWARTSVLVQQWLPPARIMHPYPDARLRVTTRRRSRMR